MCLSLIDQINLDCDSSMVSNLGYIIVMFHKLYRCRVLLQVFHDLFSSFFDLLFFLKSMAAAPSLLGRYCGLFSSTVAAFAYVVARAAAVPLLSPLLRIFLSLPSASPWCFNYSLTSMLPPLSFSAALPRRLFPVPFLSFIFSLSPSILLPVWVVQSGFVRFNPHLVRSSSLAELRSDRDRTGLCSLV